MAPLVVVVPLLAAAIVSGTAWFHPRRAVELVSIAAAVTSTVLAALLVVESAGGWVLHWFGGWTPETGGGPVPLGIDFAVDPIGAGLAAFAAFLGVAALVFGWHYFGDLEQTLFLALVLVFLAGMTGFALTGDLFNLFVFFELATVPAIVLTGFLNEEKGPLQGQISFAVTNTVAAFLILSSIALLYGRTGTLNMAAMGERLAAGEADGLVIVSFALLLCGFFVKAAIVPFHFWLADAYAVAPTPILVLFSGVMSELGLYALARVYWTVFEGPLEVHAAALTDVLLAAGAVTAVLGAVLALRQSNLKRLLAFATIGHLGLFLVGLALLTPEGLAGVALWVVADGLVRGALFMSAGIVIQETGFVDLDNMKGRARRLVPTGIVFVVGALALATLPPFGTFRGKSLVEHSAEQAGAGWVPWLFLAVSALVAGALLRAAAVAFLGTGYAPRSDSEVEHEAAEEAGEPEGGARRRLPGRLRLVPALLLALALALGLVPDLGSWAVEAAERFQDRAAYADVVLRDEEPPPVSLRPVPTPAKDVLLSLGAVAGAVLIGLLALSLPRRLVHPLERASARLALLHSGHVGDYVAWLTAGVAAFGAAFASVLS